MKTDKEVRSILKGIGRETANRLEREKEAGTVKVCNKCKGTKVWVIVYVNPNDPKIDRDIRQNPCFCCDCGGDCELIDKEGK